AFPIKNFQLRCLHHECASSLGTGVYPPQYSPLTVATAPPPEYITEDQQRTMPCNSLWDGRLRGWLSAAEGPWPGGKPQPPGRLPAQKEPPRCFLPKNRESNSSSPAPISALHSCPIGGLPCSALASSSSSACSPLLLCVSHSSPNPRRPQAVISTTAVRSTFATTRSPRKPTKLPTASPGLPAVRP